MYGLNPEMLTPPLHGRGIPPPYVPAATRRNENWNKCQDAEQVTKPFPREKQTGHLVEPAHAQLHEETCCAPGYCPGGYVAKAPRNPLTSVENTPSHTARVKPVLFGFMAGLEEGKGKSELSLPVLWRGTDPGGPPSSTRPSWWGWRAPGAGEDLRGGREMVDRRLEKCG